MRNQYGRFADGVHFGAYKVEGTQRYRAEERASGLATRAEVAHFRRVSISNAWRSAVTV